MLERCDCNKRQRFIREIIKISKKYELTIFQAVESEDFRVLSVDTEEDNYVDYYRNLSLLHELLSKEHCDKCFV